MNREIRSLTAFRGVVASIVVWFHFQTFILFPLFPALKKSALWQGTIGYGYLAVDFFFLLSGFILALSYRDAFTSGWNLRAHLRFLVLRLGRIYPVHLFTLAMMLAAFQVLMAAGKIDGWLWKYSLADLGYTLTLTQAWETTRDLTFNRPAWSISAEWAAYLAFPILAWLGLHRVTSRVLAATAAFAALALMVAAIGAAGHGDLDRTWHLALARIAGEFTAGMLLFALYDRWRADGRAASQTVARLGLALPWAALAAVAWAGALDPWAVPCFALIILSSALWDDRLGALHAPGWQALGLWSYAIYMSHHFFIRMGHEFLPSKQFAGEPFALRALIPLAYFAAVVLTSRWIFRNVEEPARAAFRAFADRHLAPIPAAPVRATLARLAAAAPEATPAPGLTTAASAPKLRVKLRDLAAAAPKPAPSAAPGLRVRRRAEKTTVKRPQPTSASIDA